MTAQAIPDKIVPTEYEPFAPFFLQVVNLVEDYYLEDLAELWFELERGFATGELDGNVYLERIASEKDFVLFAVEEKFSLDTVEH